ncbi:MAG: hypothetical protein WCT24_02485 [Patescibacteria group bacterium]
MAEDLQKIEVPQTSPSKADDVLIHVMPKEFLGKPAVTVEPITAQPAVKKVLPPPPMPALAPLAIASPIPGKSPLPPLPQKKRSMLPVAAAVVVLLLVIGAAIAYYVYFVNSQPEEIVETPVEEIPVITTPQPGQDTDSDGLTDVEELLYGTDYRNPDTDGDTFLDGNEVFHRYDPLGFSPSTLLDTGSVLLFTVKDELLGGFDLLYPKVWTIVSSSPSGIVLQTDDTATMTVEKLSNGPQTTGYTSATTKEGYTSSVSNDGRTVYLIGESGWKFTYDLGSAKKIEYLQTFQMMLNSFHELK